MARLFWKEHEIGDFGKAIALLNRLEFNLAWKEVNHGWQLWSGDKALLECDTWAELEVFVIGMAFSFAVLPDPIITEIQQLIAE